MILLDSNIKCSPEYRGESFIHLPYDSNMNFNLGIESKEVADIDVKIITMILSRINSKISLKYISFDKPIDQLLSTGVDIIPYHLHNMDDNKYIVSVPYRDEIYSVFTLNSIGYNAELEFDNIKELINLLRIRKFRLGIINNRLYQDNDINQLIRIYSTKGLIREYSNDSEALHALLDGAIDGWISTAFVGIAAVIKDNAISKINHVAISRKPISLIFNTRTLPLGLITDLKKEITDFSASRECCKVMSSYIDHFLIIKAVNSRWFFILSILGTIAFTISGIMLATQKNASLFGTIILSLLPSFISCIALHLITGSVSNDMPQYYVYVYINVIIILVIFFLLRLVGEYTSNRLFSGVIGYVIVICDTLGQAIFAILGVSIAVASKFYPLILWGPVFTLIFVVSGCIIRNILCKCDILKDVYHEVGIWVTLIWTCILAFVVENLYDLVYEILNLDTIQYATIGSTLGALCSRVLVTYYFKLKSITLFDEKKTDYYHLRNTTQ